MMRRIVPLARILLGLIFFVFGLDYFLSLVELSFLQRLLPQDAPAPTAAGAAFFEALVASGYLFHVVKAIEVASGALLLAGLFVPLALALLAPVIVNITLYHLVLDPNGLALAAGIVGLEAFLIYSYRSSFAGLLDPRARPAAGAAVLPPAAREASQGDPAG